MDDAGHGGKDPGAVSQFGREEDYTLQISLYQYNRFKELGVSVGLTRDSDVTLTEDQRVALAKQGEYCISNHLNAGGGDRAEVVHSIYDDGKLANRIKDELLKVGQNAVKVYCKEYNGTDYYYMHRRTGSTKTNIVEYCFIDNAADFQHFKEHMYEYAEAVVRAFCSHIGHPYSPPVGKKEEPINGASYTIQSGDTFWCIETKMGIKHGTLQLLNPSVNPGKLQVGQQIRIVDVPVAQPQPVQQPQPVPVAPAKRLIYLPSSAPTWTVYKINRPPVKSNPANIAGTLKPAKFGGLSYEILKDLGGWVFEIQTANFGRVKIYGHPSTGAVIK